ncbi:putative Transposase-associated domain-containing protein [Helianthus anomalus]
MTLDKSWTKITNKVDPVFINGAIAFAERGKTYVDSEGRIHCPCKKCVNVRRHVPTVVADHIIYNGFEPSYNVWIHHGEHLPGYETDQTDTVTTPDPPWTESGVASSQAVPVIILKNVAAEISSGP